MPEENEFDASGGDDYGRLPRGFHDAGDHELRRERWILDTFARHGRQIGCSLLRTSPVGHAATFRRGCGTVGDKVYAFPDRAGRELMLTPDSTPAVLRWYLARGMADPVRVAFVSPLFRYRRQKYRHFHQLGFALINEPQPPPGRLDEGALLLARAGLRVMAALRVPVVLRVTDLGVWRACLVRAGLRGQVADDALHELRPLDPGQRRAWVERCVPPGAERDELTALAGCDGPVTADGASGRVAKTVAAAVAFTQACIAGFSVRSELAFDDLHSSELQDGIAFSFATPDGVRFADGGCYGLYGRRFDPRLRTLKSFASGVEFFLNKELDEAPAEPPPQHVLVLEMDAGEGYGRGVAEELLAAGLTVVHRHLGGKLRDALRRVGGEFRWLILVGRTEEAAATVSVRDLRAGVVESVSRSTLARWLRDRS